LTCELAIAGGRSTVVRLATTLVVSVACGGAVVVAAALADRRPFEPGLAGLGARVGGSVAAVVPQTWRRSLASRLLAGGEDRPGQVEAAVGLRVMTAAAAAAVVLAAVSTAGPRPVVLAVAGVLAMAVAAAPELALRRRTAERARLMRRDLPRHLDLLTISVEAGLGFDQALDRVVRALPGPLADEFARMSGEVRAGMPRGDSLRAMAERCPVDEVRLFAMAMVQADSFGVSVGPVLRNQAVEMRIRHRQSAQMQAQKAPVKLLIPMVLCIFPALLVVLAGPALLSIRSLFSG
jgi:tight adherence protein C